jgi:hypothetical protein
VEPRLEVEKERRWVEDGYGESLGWSIGQSASASVEGCVGDFGCGGGVEEAWGGWVSSGVERWVCCEADDDDQGHWNV